ncbi:MAG TPA: LytTR family DNA-binding domain-containing protein [Lentimicrobium sp.]|nr:LytTR family DNA-binding domain-containing protein [Lentimicrobium sp.]
MKVVIVEDENLVAQNLKSILNEIGTIDIIATLESVNDTVAWFTQNDSPDILFLDIHLADGTAFEIFDRVKIDCPVIFTTAYDEYALKAFKVNSIDYLLKPIDIHSVRRSLDKYKKLTGVNANKETDLQNLISYFEKNKVYRSNFLVPFKGDKLIPLNTDDIAYIFIDFGTVKSISYENKSYYMDNTLDEIEGMLNPDMFFRANRQFIISRKAVKDIDLWFNSRLSVNLKVSVPEKILVSKARVPEFKNWFAGKK